VIEDACAEIVLRGDPDRHATARLAGDRASRLFALYAFNLEVARIPSVVSEPLLGEIRLQWWRDAVAEIFDGAPPRRHEVVTPLAETIQAADLPRALFEALLDARAADIHGPRFADRAALDAYLAGTGGALMRLSAQALGGGAAADAAAADFGWASGAANLIRALPALYARGADPVPTATPPDRNALFEGATPPEVAEALRGIARDGLARIVAARARRRETEAETAPAFLAGWEAERILKAAAAPGYDLFAGAEASEFRRRGALAWRGLTGRW
jgi:15-cis-phytoene synthase